MGIGAGLLFGLIWADGLLVALGTFVVGGGLHTLTHYTDRHIGGHSSDVPLLGLVVAAALVAIYARVRGKRKSA